MEQAITKNRLWNPFKAKWEEIPQNTYDNLVILARVKMKSQAINEVQFCLKCHMGTAQRIVEHNWYRLKS